MEMVLPRWDYMRVLRNVSDCIARIVASTRLACFRALAKLKRIMLSKPACYYMLLRSVACKIVRTSFPRGTAFAFESCLL